MHPDISGVVLLAFFDFVDDIQQSWLFKKSRLGNNVCEDKTLATVQVTQ
jgi:hypothetical protein